MDEFPRTADAIEKEFNLRRGALREAFQKIGEEVIPHKRMEQRLTLLAGAPYEQRRYFMQVLEIARFVELGRNIGHEEIMTGMKDGMEAAFSDPPRQRKDIEYPYALAYKARILAGIRLRKDRPKGGFKTLGPIRRVK